jgi:hypothetical protein
MGGLDSDSAKLTFETGLKAAGPATTWRVWKSNYHCSYVIEIDGTPEFEA